MFLTTDGVRMGGRIGTEAGAEKDEIGNLRRVARQFKAKV